MSALSERLENLPYRIVDLMTSGLNELYRSCGERLWPDCDVSSASIVDEFEDHLRRVHAPAPPTPQEPEGAK